MTAKTVDPLSGMPVSPSGKKLMHAVVVTAGPGTRMLELQRTGAARHGLQTWVDGEKVLWLTTDRSALMPIVPGKHKVTWSVKGKEGSKFRIRAVRPSGTKGYGSGTVPKGGKDKGQFDIEVP